MDEYLAAVKELHAKARELFPRPPLGCTPAAVAALEAALTFELPAAYRAFLLWIGRDDGGAFGTKKCALHDLDSNAVSLEDLIEANDLEYVLPGAYVAFLGEEGRQHAWFRLPAEAEDPLVYSLNLDEEVTASNLQTHPTFSGFILEELKDSILTLAQQKFAAPEPRLGKLMTLARYATVEEAQLAKNALTGSGIAAVLQNQNIMGTYPWFATLFGGVELQVPVAQAEAAAAVLRGEVDEPTG